MLRLLLRLRAAIDAMLLSCYAAALLRYAATPLRVAVITRF